MSKLLQLRGGTTTEHASFTGAVREVTVDTTKKTLVVHDGSTAGGFVVGSTDAEIRAAVEAATDSNVFTDADHTKLNGVAASANNYTHPTGAGNSHVPAGGSDGQVLSLSAYGAGGYAWVAQTTDTNTTYSAGTGLDISGTTFSVEADLRDGITHVGLDSGDYIGFSDNASMNFFVNGSERVRIEADGDIHADGNIIAYSTTISDERLKTDIVKIQGALDKVSQLSGYTFTYTADGKKSAGVIAQEVHNVLPSAIVETTLPLKVAEGDDTEYMTVQYDQLIGLLIEAVKELKSEYQLLRYFSRLEEVAEAKGA